VCVCVSQLRAVARVCVSTAIKQSTVGACQLTQHAHHPPSSLVLRAKTHQSVGSLHFLRCDPAYSTLTCRSEHCVAYTLRSDEFRKAIMTDPVLTEGTCVCVCVCVCECVCVCV
jgi:hypothetical protein